MRLSLTPLTLLEAELYAFYTHKVDTSDLPFSFRLACEDPIYKLVSQFNAITYQDLNLLHKSVADAVKTFNQFHIHKWNANLATAKLVCNLQVFNYSNTHATVSWDAYIEYRGITQREADTWPKDIQDALYNKYLRLTNTDDLLRNTSQNVLSKFKGRHLSPILIRDIEASLHAKLLSFPEVSSVHTRYESNYLYVNIKHSSIQVLNLSIKFN